jgi:hypothetical protein
MSTASAHGGYTESARGAVTFGVSFGGIMLITVGIFQVLEGIAAIAKDKIYVSGPAYVYSFDVSTWGWIHLIVGAIAVLVAIGILAGQTWGMIGGVVIAALGALANFAFLPYYPFWSMTIIALYVFVIWALCAQMMRREEM